MTIGLTIGTNAKNAIMAFLFYPFVYYYLFRKEFI